MTMTVERSIRPAAVCQAFFILAAAGVLLIASLPTKLKRHVLNYGARQAGMPGTNGRLEYLARTLASWGQVPHSWFATFYGSYIICSVVWGFQFFSKGAILQTIAHMQASSQAQSMGRGQVLLVWALTILQASRRLYEQLFVFNTSSSQMWVLHWLLGLLFYLCLSISIWVEAPGSSSALNALSLCLYYTKT
jgi:3-oxo-5-alpha-steroid 4-dehydrogenase 3 / polyprenol reductase